MSYQALYRKWRPQVFEDVIGQKHITETLKNQVIAHRTAHAYLLCGTRGTGKTSTAKIFSRAVNCLSPENGNPCNVCDICTGIIKGSIMDVVEIDAASNNGVDNVREIRDEVAYSPARGKYKVYIIDEVHMLSTGAFNALLKTLEEPPSHVMFILATTEPHKIPATILSRCQRFDFKRITVDDIVERLKQVTIEDNIDAEEKGLRLVARISEGSMRDALSILDQCIAFGSKTITYENISAVLGTVDHSLLLDMARHIADRSTEKAIELIDLLIREGRDIVHFMSDLIEHFRNLLLCKVMENAQDILDMSNEATVALKDQSVSFTQERIIHCIKQLSEAHSTIKWAANPRTVLEIAVIKLCVENLDFSAEAIMDRISNIEQKLAQGTMIFSPQMDIKQEVVKKPAQVKGLVNDKKGSIVKNIVDNKVASFNAETKKAAGMWPEILTEVRKAGKLALFGHLADVRVEPVNNVLVLFFSDSHATNKLMVSRAENIKLIEEMIQKVSGSAVKVKCLLEKEAEQIERIEKEDRLEQIIQFKEELGDVMQVFDE
ncbi:MAG: DNA polymerase III subunit gamma/tau [Clostridia bacterium]